METNIYKDRILETENLTDELEDADANWLIQWGISRLAPLLTNIEDDEAAGNKVNDLMAVMRKINRICGFRQSKNVFELASEFVKLSRLFHTAFEQAPLANYFECLRAAIHLTNQKTTAQALEFLARWGEPPVLR